MERYLKKYWPYIAGTAAAIGAVITFGWDVFTYFHGRDQDQGDDQRPAIAASPITAEANPQGSLPGASEPAPKSAEPTSPASQAAAQPADMAEQQPPLAPPPANVTATGGIAIGGSVSDSELRVDAQGN